MTNTHAEPYFRTYLLDAFEKRRQKNAQYSLRSFARWMGVDPSALSRIMTGKKIPSPKLSELIFERLEVAPSHRKRFLHSVAQAYELQPSRRKPKGWTALAPRKKPAQEHELSADAFQIIADWYHYAILQLMQTEGFRNDPAWIARELGVSKLQIKAALERLIDLKILRQEKGELVRVAGPLTTGDVTQTAAAFRERIRQITAKSLTSLESDPIVERSHTTVTLSIDPARIAVAKQMIDQFMDQHTDALQTRKKRVYELQVNLFPLQRKSP